MTAIRRWLVIAAAILPIGQIAAPAQASSPLDGKTYIIEMSSSQSASGYAEYLVPPLARAIDRAGLKAKGGPGADVVFNVITHSDVGQWIETAGGRQWVYTMTVTTGISPESYSIPFEGTPQFGVAARLITLNSDREDELACLIDLATREAIARYRPKGIIEISGQSCLRKQ
jgi:hypothetical protein